MNARSARPAGAGTADARRFASATALLAVLALSACAAEPSSSSDPSNLRGEVVTDGSSTVAPLTVAARHLFIGEHPDVDIKVTTTGTSAGFRAFCAGKTDISNASRQISEDEAAACEDNGVEFTEIVVANDGISVIVNPENDWVTDLSVEQLAKIWAPEAEGEITTWKQIDPDFPDEPLVLFGPGSDSGTLDFFTAAITGAEGAIRADYSASEDDEDTVAGVREHTGALGFLGLSYVEENEGDIVVVPVDGITPDVQTVQDGSYTPLGRPLFIYVNDDSYADKPQVMAFVDFSVQNSVEIAEAALVVPLTDAQIEIAEEELAALR